MGSVGHKWDEQAGLIRVRGEGLYSLSQVEEHFRTLGATIAHIRASHGRVRVLVDIRDGVVQSAEVAQAVSRWQGRLYSPGDRVALIVKSALHKMQMRRVVNLQITEMFVSETAARTWLKAFDPQNPAGSEPADRLAFSSGSASGLRS